MMSARVLAVFVTLFVLTQAQGGGRTLKEAKAVIQDFLAALAQGDPRNCLSSMICNVGANATKFGKVGARMVQSFGDSDDAAAISGWKFPAGFDSSNPTELTTVINKTILIQADVVPPPAADQQVVKNISLPAKPMMDLKPLFEIRKPTITYRVINVTKMELPKFELPQINMSKVFNFNLTKNLFAPSSDAVVVKGDSEIQPRFLFDFLEAFKRAFAIGQNGGEHACREAFPRCFMTTKDIVTVLSMAFPPE